MLEKQVEQRIGRCDTWLASGVENVLSQALRVKPDSLRYLKAICEIAFFTSLAPNKYSMQLVHAVDDVLEQVWSNGQLACTTRHNLQHANLFLPLLYACRARLSLSVRQEVDIRRLAKLALSHTKERIPFREIDLRYVAWKITGDQGLHDAMLEIASHGCLREGANSASIAYEDDYAITHTIFYLTDFGIEPWPQRLGVASSRVVDGILDALRHCPRNRQNLDLRGEFLLSRAYVGTEPGVVLFEIDNVSEAQRSDGRWDGPVDLSTKLKDEGTPEPYWNFLLHYHTTLVCREALAAWTKRDPSERSSRTVRRDVSRPPNAQTCTEPSRATDSAECQALEPLISGYITALSSEEGLVAEGLLLNPYTVVGAVQLALARFAMGSLNDTERASLRGHAEALVLGAGLGVRVARLAMTMLYVVDGTAPAEQFRNWCHACLVRVSPRLYAELSNDEACLLAIGLCAGVFDQLEKQAIERAIDLTLDRHMGAQDIASVGEVALSAAVSGLNRRAQDLAAFYRSYRAASFPFGYLHSDESAARAMRLRAELSHRQYRLAQRLFNGKSPSQRNPPPLPVPTL